MSLKTPGPTPKSRPHGDASDDADAMAGFRILSAEEAWQMYDSEAREFLGISADEFDERWENGDLKARIEEPHVLDVYMIRTPKPSRG